MDVSDQATAHEERDRELVLRFRRIEGPQPAGYCLNCGPGTRLPPEQRWCDLECRDEWSRLNKQ